MCGEFVRIVRALIVPDLEGSSCALAGVASGASAIARTKTHSRIIKPPQICLVMARIVAPPFVARQRREPPARPARCPS
jgi:hypothetical protein